MLSARGDRYLLFAFALLVLGLSLIYALFGQRPLDFDESGIFNAPYMFAQYSKISYPVWVSRFPEYFDTYWFHPPTYYVLLGSVLKLLSIYYAEGILPTLLFALCVYFAVVARIGPAAKYAYLWGTFALLVLSITTQMSNFGVRPDMAAALTWFAGLLAMEKARLDGWSRPYLAAGAFLIVLAAVIHYITMFFVLSLLVYAVLAWRDLSRSEFTKAAGAVALGGCLVGVPYLLFFFLPNLDHIIVWLTKAEGSNEHGPNPIAILKFKLESARNWNMAGNPVPLFKIIPGGLHAALIPVGLLAAGGLLLFRDTRIIGGAVLPEMLFIYFVADKIQPMYLMSEYLLVFVLVSYVVLRGFSWILRQIRLSALEHPTLFLAALAATVSLTAYSPKFAHAFKNAGTVQHHWMDVARAAAQTMIGTNAVVGEYIATWYMTGARYWYPEGYGRPLHVPTDERAYIETATIFTHYDLRTAADQYAYHAGSGGKALIGGWVSNYVQGRLHLVGVINVPGTALVFYAPKQQEDATHYQIDTDRLSVDRFRAAATGDTVFGAYLCLRLEDQPPRNSFEHLHAYATFMDIDGVNPQVVGIFRTTASSFAKMRDALSKDCTLKDVRFGTTERLSFSEFMASVPQFHKEMSFFRTREAAVLAQKQGAEK